MEATSAESPLHAIPANHTVGLNLIQVSASANFSMALNTPSINPFAL
jgi:hypothetical protein